MFPSFRISVLCLLLALPARAEVEYVIAISVDGGRGDFLKSFIEEAPEEFPNFSRLRSLSAATYEARCDVTDSITIPNHLCMLTGRPVRPPEGMPASVAHGYTENAPAAQHTVHNTGLTAGIYKASIFDAVHDSGLSTAAYLGKNRLQICERSWNASNGAEDTTGADFGRDKIDLRVVREATDPSVTAEWVEQFAETIRNSTVKRFTFVHFAEADYAGHMYGWDPTPGSTYRRAVRIIDGWLGQILDAIEENGALNGRTALLLTADHGGGTPFLTHLDPTVKTNFTIPFFLMAPGMPGGSDLYAAMDNRFHPGLEQPSYSAPQQPIRNGDVANFSAALLGVPPVVGALLQPALRPVLKLERSASGLLLSWPGYLTGYTVEQSGDLAQGRWEPVIGPVLESGGWRYLPISGPLPAAGYFRLHSPVFASAAPRSSVGKKAVRTDTALRKRAKPGRRSH